MFKKSLLVSIIAMGLTSSTYANTVLPTEANEFKKIDIQVNDEKSLMDERIKMLELSLIGSSPEETINNFAEAVKTRNGAMQYALFSSEARVGLTKPMENSHWVTGVSSPWVEAYQVVEETKIQTNQVEYVIEFDLYTSTGFAGKDSARLTVEKINDYWYITSLGPTTENSIGIWNTHESVKEINSEDNFQEMKTYKSPLGYNVQFPVDIMKKLKIEESTCENEEGNPSCTLFYYKDAKQNKDILLMSLLRLTSEQENLSYYKEHPFLTKVGANNKGSFYYVTSSEHPYGENENSKEGIEWTYLVDVLKERIQNFSPNS